MSSDDDDERMEVPGIGAGAVLSEARRVSGDVVRKVSDAARKLSGERRRSSAHELLEDDMGDEHISDSSASLCTKVLAAVCFGIALIMLTLGMYVQSAVNGAEAVTGAMAGAVAGAGENVASSRMHQHITERQRKQHENGEAVHVSCKSAGNMHLLAALPVGASCHVLCHAGCASMDWVLLHKNVAWGSNATDGAASGYADASLLCLAAQHATGEDGGEFTITITAGGSSFAGSSAHGVVSSSHEGQHQRAFVVGLRRTAAQVVAAAAAREEVVRTRNKEVKPSELRAHFLTALATVPRELVALRFFAFAVGSTPRTSVLGDFELLDASKTGEVSPEQFLAPPNREAHKSGEKPIGSRWTALETQSFEAMDSNGDGLLNIEEYQRGYNGFERALSKVITNADKDGNRRISYLEMEQLGPEEAMQLLSFHSFVGTSKDPAKAELR